MPRRSSRSRPASRTSLSDPIGSASLAMAMVGRLTVPLERLADPAEPGSRGLVAEGAVDAGLVEGAWIEAEARRRLVVARQVGVEHRGIVRRDRAAEAGCGQPRQRMVVQALHRARAQVRE